MANMNNFMKQAQTLQANMQRAQAEIAQLEVTGEAGGGQGRHEWTARGQARAD